MATRPSLRRHREDIPFEEIAITPVMNLFIILIPFLLVSAVFLKIGTIKTTIPLIGAEGGPAQVQKRITLTLGITQSGFFLKGAPLDINTTGNRASMDPSHSYQREGVVIGRTVDGRFDYDQLAKILVNVKQEYPSEDTIIIMPESYIPYNVIVKTMDSVRTYEIEDGSKPIPRELFPKALIAAKI